MRSQWRSLGWFYLACIAGVFLQSSTAAAAPKVGIVRFTGRGETEVRVAVTRAIGTHGFALVGARAFEDNGDGPPMGREAVKEAGARLKLAALIDGRVEIEHGVGTARIAVRDPRDGSVTANESWSVRHGGATALARSVGKTFWRRLGPALETVSGHRGHSKLVARRSRHRQR
jgi:hypothetical protein